MKRITLFILAAGSLLCANAADEFTGKITTQSTATSVTTGQWYTLYNTGAKTFLCDGGGGTLTTSSTPATNWASDYEGCFVQLESAGGDTYYLKTGLGNYIGALTQGTTTATTATAEAAFTVASDGSSWTISNSGRYLNGEMASDTSEGDNTSWTIYAATLNSESELSAANRLTFQGKIMSGGNAFLARLQNKRSSTKYLTATGSGAAGGANLTSKTEMSQIWLITPSGSGYTLLNAETGDYLTGTYSSPGSETTLYIEQSPNNGTNDYYYCISSSSEFSGKTCLNLGNDGATLYEWSCGEGDTGSDWAMEMVYEVEVDDVMASIEESNPYAKELAEGTLYRIVNYSYGSYMVETNGGVKCQKADDTNFAQYWQLEKNGSGWAIRNVLTDNYIQRQGSRYSQYLTSTSPVAFYIVDTGDAMKNSWFIENNTSGSLVLHCDASSVVVPWYTSADASKWQFLEVEEIDEDALAAAKDELGDYDDLVANLSTIQASLDNLFADKACTTLNSDIAALTDEQLAANTDYASLPAAVQEMVMKVKNDTWDIATSTSTVTDSYERLFRIADYRPYSHHQNMAYNCTGQSNCFGKLSGPTGIFVNSGDILYIYVDENASSDCTLQVELVSTDGTPGDHTTGTTTNLTAGLNVLRAEEEDVVYIFYQLDNTSKYLADYPDIKVHIEGGTINGYWDATRGMTNQDWANMKTHGLLGKCSVLNLKTEHLVFAMDTELVQSAITTAHNRAGDSQENVELLMRVWDMIPTNEESYQGIEEYEGRMRNVWNAFSVNYNYMFATSYGTYYENSTLATVMNYYEMTHSAGSLWGPSHEMGHNHQAAINLIGTTESSNNLFSNINVYEAGISTTRGPSTKTNFNDYLANGSSWLDRDIWVTTRMFLQLYLYFHVMENDTEFLPNLFKALRKDPITKNGSSSKGSNDYLHFAEKVCEVAEADLSEFFEAYGMFVPVDNQLVDDYSTYYVTTTQSDINNSKKKMQKYEKKLGNIMFIDDHIDAKKPADPDNKFEAVPSGEYRVDYSSEYPIGIVDVGDYEDYDGRTEYGVSDDYYTLSGSTIQFKGSGYVGHKVYDLDGNLIWACANKSASLPSAIKSMFPDEVVVVAAEANMEDVPCPYYKSGSSDYKVYGMQVSFPDGVSNKWWASDNIDDYLPTNAIAVITSSEAPEAVTSSINVVDTDGTAQSIVIDGDEECRIPQDISAAQLTFTKSGEGFYALSLPFAMNNVNTISGNDYVNDTNAAAGEPVIANGATEYHLSNVAVVAGDHTKTESGYILSADGSEVAMATDITPFTYLFDSAFELGNLDGINELTAASDTGEQTVYDLSGRRVTRITKPGIYIVNGVKTLVK